VFLSRQQTTCTVPIACIRFAALSRIEILHILLEHFYDSQRNEDAGSARRLHRRQPVARSQDLFSPLRQFQRRLAVVGSVAHLVAKDPAGTINRSDDMLSIELIQPDSMPAVVRIVWPTALTITITTRYNEVASTAMRLLAEASTTLTRIKASKQL
jgi:hypothetical protein